MNPFKRAAGLINALAAAFLAALTAQLLHEFMHGAAAALVGNDWQAFNLFAVLWAWQGAPDTTRALIIEANPALINLITGLLAVWLFKRTATRPMLRLYLMYFAGYSLFMGFGYLLTDPLFYDPASAQLGDWKKVIDLFGGSWAIRLPLIALGAGGVLLGFFWLARSAMRFATDATDKAQRASTARRLLLLPYLIVNGLFTIMAFWHPVGPDGIFIIVFQYWFGYVGLFWAFFLAAYWLKFETPYRDVSALPDRLVRPGVFLATLGLIVAVALFLPTIYF